MPAETMIACENLTEERFGHCTALDAVSSSVVKGSIFRLPGPVQP